MVPAVRSYVMVQEMSANLEYHGLKPNWFLYSFLVGRLGELVNFTSSCFLCIFCSHSSIIVIIYLDSYLSYVVNINSVIVNGYELGWTFRCECGIDYHLVDSLSSYRTWYFLFGRT